MSNSVFLHSPLLPVWDSSLVTYQPIDFKVFLQSMTRNKMSLLRYHSCTPNSGNSLTCLRICFAFLWHLKTFRPCFKQAWCNGACEGMKITSSGEHKLHRGVRGNPELVPALQAILERTFSGIMTQLPKDRTYMIYKNKFKCCSYYLMANHNVFKCVYDISPLSTWSTWQTMIYTTQMPLWLDRHFSFHFSWRKTKTENFCGFPVLVRGVFLRTGNTAKLFYSFKLSKSHRRVVEEEQCMLKETFENHIVWPLAKKRASLDQVAQDLFQLSFEYPQDIAQSHWANCSNIWLPSLGDFFPNTWKFYSYDLSPWPLAQCAPLGRVWLSLHYIVFS